jgi:hypothetical protein
MQRPPFFVFIFIYFISVSLIVPPSPTLGLVDPSADSAQIPAKSPTRVICIQVDVLQVECSLLSLKLLPITTDSHFSQAVSNTI